MKNKGIAPLIAILVIATVAGSVLTYSYLSSRKSGSINFAGLNIAVPFSALSEGSTFLSPPTQTNLISNDPLVGGKAWVFSVSQNGAGQSATGYFTSDQIKDPQTGARATNNFSIKLTMDSQNCQYPMRDAIDSFYKADVSTTSYFWPWEQTSAINSCQTNVGTPYIGYHDPRGYSIFGGTTWDNTVYCVKKTLDGYYSTIGDSTLNFKSTITLNIDGQSPQAATINNKESTSANIGSMGTVAWAGNLVSGESCPIPSSNTVSGAYKVGWTTIDTNQYFTYKNYKDAGFDVCLNSYANNGQGSIQSCIDNFNRLKSNALLYKAFTSSGGSVATTSGSLYDGKVYIDLAKAIQYPVMTFHIKADYFGIYIPVGKPQIVSVISQEFQTGSSGYITTQVKNIGDAQGAFSVSANCGSGFSQTGTTQYANINPQETQTVVIPITGTTQTSLSSTCTITAQDRNNPSNYDTKSVTVTVKALTICGENQFRCNGKVIEKCLSNIWQPQKTCDYQCSQPISGGEPSCVSAGTITPPAPGPEGNTLEACYASADRAKSPLDITGTSTWGGKINCISTFKAANLLIGIFAAILILFFGWKFSLPWPVHVAGGIIIFVIGLANIWVPIAIVAMGIIFLTASYMKII